MLNALLYRRFVHDLRLAAGGSEPKTPKDCHILTGTLFRRRSSRVTLSETPPQARTRATARRGCSATRPSRTTCRAPSTAASWPTGPPWPASSGPRGRGSPSPSISCYWRPNSKTPS